MPRVAAAPLGVLIGLPIAACFVKPSAPEGTVDDARVSDSAGSGSSVIVDAMPDGLVVPSICTPYEFTGNSTVGCGGWATEIAPIATAGNGNLTLTVNANGSAGGGAACLTQTQSSSSITINLTSFQPDNPSTQLTLSANVGGAIYAASIGGQSLSQTITVTCETSITPGQTWSLAAGRFLRLVWRTDNSLQFEMAPSASATFAVLQTCPVSKLISHTFGLDLKRGSGGNAQQAAIDSVEICP